MSSVSPSGVLSIIKEGKKGPWAADFTENPAIPQPQTD
jgi:hypothetical protein